MGSRTMSIVVAAVFSIVCVATERPTPSGGPAGLRPYRVIWERNMFSPTRGTDEQQEEEAERERQAEEAAARARIKVIGIVRRDDFYSSIAIVEANGRQRLCRTGDLVSGMLVLAIRSREVVFESAAGRWIAEIQPAMRDRRVDVAQIETGGAPADSASGGFSVHPGRRLPIPRGEVRRLARSVKFVPDVEGGATRGLRLTEDFIGLKEGDRVTHVGCQSLCTEHPRQKLWQIARKYAACREETVEIQVVVIRENRTIEFVLCPYS